ncbi:WD40-repeat-containing domain protein [Gigaspora rosea]|uniref:WD40-repeat-containing domain protein n=1 Tax=Gigaspora rosea TaxID=44941 RepID=A0A397W872_9GLOM|nr:WD40-repeat-containing domain protein [Gigaspora rosea]
MKVKTFQIHWHKDTLPIFSIHFQPGGTGRFATAGMDYKVMMWKLVKNQTELPQVIFLSTLKHHTAPVNVVRFSPKGELLASAGDDGIICLWKLMENKDSKKSFGDDSDDDTSEDSETWKAISLLRGSPCEIIDIAWSPDGEYIVAACMDGGCRIWRVKDAKCVCVLMDHVRNVQGVAWDPLGEYIATQGNDRNVHIYSYNIHSNGSFEMTHVSKNFKVEILNKKSQKSSIKEDTTKTYDDLNKHNCDGDNHTAVQANSESNVAANGISNNINPMLNAIEGSESIKPEPSQVSTTLSTPKQSRKQFRLFCDEMINTFFRRLDFTPDGGLLLTPAGQYRNSMIDLINDKNDKDESNHKVETTILNTVYLFARNKLNKPIAFLPGHKKPSIVVKCSHIFYKLRFPRKHPQPQIDATALQTTSEYFMTDSSHNDRSPNNTPSLFDLPYRIIYAVATQDSVFIYDTEQYAPLVIATNLHFATFSDMSWSPDGNSLMLASHDGFCSVMTFREGELGEHYADYVPMSRDNKSIVDAPQVNLADATSTNSNIWQNNDHVNHVQLIQKNGSEIVAVPMDIVSMQQTSNDIIQDQHVQKKRRIAPKLIQQL